MNKKKTIAPSRTNVKETKRPLSYFSVCSGMEAATVAWEPLGWECKGLCDFASFPQKVLKHLYPDVPFYPNMLNLLNDENFKKTDFDVFVGGTPCQAFSSAGLGKGMDDERSQLAIKYGTILDEKSPKYSVWENVDGVFDKKHKEGLCDIISTFTGIDFRPDQISRGGGVVQGTKRSIAYRVFDSQYFGVPQRRKRVYIVGYRGTDWRVPAAILFDEGCFESPEKKNQRQRDERTKSILGEIRIAGTVTKSYSQTLTDGFGKQSTSNFWVDKKGIRKFTEKELLRLQGFPDDYLDFEIDGKKPSYSNVKGIVGNSMTVNVMRWIGERIQLVEDMINSREILNLEKK
jgi:DNA (cytosine-5)-methyltransferase 1